MDKEDYIAAIPGQPVDKLVKRFVQIREARAAYNKAADAEDANFKELLKAIEIELLKRAQADGVEGFKTEYGTTYKDVMMSASFADEELFFNFVKKTGDLDFFERRIKIAHLKEWMDRNGGELPPGLNIFRELTMRIRRK